MEKKALPIICVTLALSFWKIGNLLGLNLIYLLCLQDNCMLSDLTLSSCQIGLDDKDKLVRYVILSVPFHYRSGRYLTTKY